MILRHGVGKCVCMCFIDDLKLNHIRIWLYIAHQIFSLILYQKKKKKNYPIKLPKPKSYLSPYLKKKKNTRRGSDVLMVVEGQYNGGGDSSNSSFSLFQVFC